MKKIRMRIISYFLVTFFLCFIVGLNPITAQNEDSIQYDQKERSWRTYDSDRMEKFSSDPEFSYKREKANTDFWDSFLKWLSRFFGKKLETKDGLNWGGLFEIFIYIFAIAGVIYLIVRLVNSGMRGAIYDEHVTKQVYEVGVENIHEINFVEEIDKAVKENNLKKAIRLIYLFSLKKLSESKLIIWEQGKTNHDYSYELKDSSAFSNFSRLSYFFEFTWYGNFDVSREIFDNVRQTFSDLEKNIRDEKN